MSLFSFSAQHIHFSSGQISVSCDLQVDAGVVHLCGENGIGKTSLLQSMAGILRFEGHGELAGRDIKKLSAQEKKMASYCPDQYQFSTELTPLEYLEFIALSYGLKSKKDSYLAFINQLGVESSLLNKKIKALSYGTVKKVLITAALLPNAKLVLMDEPTNGLDKAGKAGLVEHIKKFREQTLFVIVCHDDRWMAQYDPIKIEIS